MSPPAVLILFSALLLTVHAASSVTIHLPPTTVVGHPSPSVTIHSPPTVPTLFVGRCPEVCRPNVVTAFNECASLESRGCIMANCGHGDSEGFICTVARSLPLNPFKVQPGDKVIFDGLVVGKRTTFSNNFDVPAPATGKTDIYLLTDASGSMSSKLPQVRPQFNKIMRMARETFDDFAIGVGIYRDESELDAGFENLQGITKNYRTVRQNVRNITAMGGADVSEANLVALYKIATEESIQWRSDSRRIVVMFGDSPGHEPTCVDGLRLTRADVILALEHKGISVVAAGTGTGLDAAPTVFGCEHVLPAPAGQTSAITSGTDGRFLESIMLSDLAEDVLSAIKTVPTTIDVDTSDCDENVDIAYANPLPITIVDPVSALVKQTISLKNSACASGAFKCQLKYSSGGLPLAPVMLEFKAPRGCPVESG